MLAVTSQLAIPLREIRFSFARSSGPGGQNVNKVSSKAVLRWPVVASPSLPEDVRQRFLARHRRQVTGEGDLVITSQRFRDAGRNVADCLEKLRQMLRESAAAPRPRKPTRPTRASRQRRIAEKRIHSRKKQQRRAGTDD